MVMQVSFYIINRNVVKYKFKKYFIIFAYNYVNSFSSLMNYHPLDFSYISAYFVGVEDLDAIFPRHNYSHINSVIFSQ